MFKQKMPYIRYIYHICCILVLMLCFVVHAKATVISRPLGNESRIRVINYVPNAVIRYVGHFLYHTIIEFAPDETIVSITMGDASGWQLHPVGNRLFLKPVNENTVVTNMVLLTDKRMYFFEMFAEYATGVQDENLIFLMKFVYPDSPGSSSGVINLPQTLVPPDLTRPDTYNFNYKISGKASEIEPILIFDDGQFTYFKFRDRNTDLPAFFYVDDDGSEGIVNYRVFAGYVIVERVEARFTLRHGHQVICVFNEAFNPLLDQGTTNIPQSLHVPNTLSKK